MLVLHRNPKAQVVSLLVFATLIIVGSFWWGPLTSAFSNIPPASNTGAPGELTCTSCHGQNARGGNVIITGIPPAYTPGVTYPLTVSVIDTGTVFGFQLTALRTDGSQAGNLQNISAVTEVTTGNVLGNTRQYIGQTFAGRLFSSWTFNWTAPTPPVGPITFYATGMRANADSGTLGDTTYQTLSVPTATDGVIAGRVTSSDGAPLSGTTIRVTGTQSRITITDSNGNYLLDSVETNGFYTVTPSRANYTFSPASQSFSFLGSRAEASFNAQPTGPTENPLDTSEFFVRQQYLDFLGREPDAGGLSYWSDEIGRCGTNARCLHNRRVDVSTAFFVEQEFQDTGSFVYRMYRSSYGRTPFYSEFLSDMSKVNVGADRELSKQAFANEWVTRAKFANDYPATMTVTDFVNKLFDTADLMPYAAERRQQIAAMEAGKTRAQVLRDVADFGEFRQREYNPSFTLMQYFAYLLRDADQGGYDFWLDVLNNRSPNNYRGVVCAFITSAEYQKRFGSVVTRSNADCAP